MNRTLEDLPPIRFSLGGRIWQMCAAAVSTLATYTCIFDDHLPFRSAGLAFFMLAACFMYLSFKKARVAIFSDRVEFTDFRAVNEVIGFSDIAKVELIRGNRSLRTVVTTKSRDRKIELPYVYKIPFYDLRRYLQKRYDDPLSVVHSLSDGSQDRDVWNAPNSKAT